MSVVSVSRRKLSVGTGAITAAALSRPAFATVDRSDIVDLRLSWRMDSGRPGGHETTIQLSVAPTIEKTSHGYRSTRLLGT
jgi:hypothetical protein